MKKTFRTILAGALALLTVSCYDDSALRTDIADLKERVTELENKLNSEVSTLNTTIGALQTEIASLKTADANFMTELGQITAQLDAIDGKIDGKVSASESAVLTKIEDLKKDYAALEKVSAETIAKLTAVGVTKVEKNAAGNAVITFVDGNTVEVPAKPSTGIVTIVDGKWAVVGADGKTTVLDAQLHPDTKIEFQVDPKTGELKYSLGGQFVSTGAYVAGETFSVVTNVVEGDGIVTITIGGVEYDLPLVSTNTFEILSGMVFFNEGATKTIPVKMKGVVSAMLANAPAGWDAKLVGNSVQVTAPGESASEDEGGMYPGVGPLTRASSADEYETFGTIEVWVVTEDGKTFVGKLSVSLSTAFAEISISGGNVTVDVPMVEVLEWNDTWTEQVPTGEYDIAYKPVFFGACEADKFDGASLQNILDMFLIGEDEASYPEIFACYDLVNGYPTWLSTKTVPLATLLGEEPVAGKSYVVWSYCRNNNDEYENSDMTFVKKYYSHVAVTIAEPVASWNDADLNISVVGVENFHLMVMPKMMFDEYSMGYWSEEALQMFGGMFSFWDVYMPGMLHYTPGKEYAGSYNGKATLINPDEMVEFAPGEELVACVLPLDPSKANADYSFADVVTKTFKLADLKYNGAATVTVSDVVPTLTSVSAKVVSDKAAMTVYTFVQPEYLASEVDTTSTTELIDYMILELGNAYKSKDSDFTARNNTSEMSFDVETDYIMLTMAIDADGKCSNVVKTYFKTLGYPIKDDITVSVEGAPVFDAKKVTVTYKVTGASKLALYGYMTYHNASNPKFTTRANDSDAAISNIASKAAYNIAWFDVPESGLVTVTYSNYSSAYKYSYVVGCNWDADGNVVSMSDAFVFDATTYAAQ